VNPVATAPRTSNRGFTLLEILIAVSVLAIIGTMAIPSYFSTVEAARVAACVAEVRILSREIGLYQMMNSEYPDSLADIKREKTTDPWGRLYEYLNLQDVVDDGADDFEHVPPEQSGEHGNAGGNENGNGSRNGDGGGDGGGEIGGDGGGNAKVGGGQPEALNGSGGAATPFGSESVSV
jgi:prepilin-type N-terminal cleavage/methylation domain-containing protein